MNEDGVKYEQREMGRVQREAEAKENEVSTTGAPLLSSCFRLRRCLSDARPKLRDCHTSRHHPCSRCQTHRQCRRAGRVESGAVCGVRLTRYCRKGVTFATGAGETVEYPTYSTARRAAPCTSKLEMVFLLQKTNSARKSKGSCLALLSWWPWADQD